MPQLLELISTSTPLTAGAHTSQTPSPGSNPIRQPLQEDTGPATRSSQMLRQPSKHSFRDHARFLARECSLNPPQQARHTTTRQAVSHHKQDTSKERRPNLFSQHTNQELELWSQYLNQSLAPGDIGMTQINCGLKDQTLVTVHA